MASVIPFGQPILVGHYSEKSDRRHRSRIHSHVDNWSELDNYAHELERRAASVDRKRKKGPLLALGNREPLNFEFPGTVYFISCSHGLAQTAGDMPLFTPRFPAEALLLL
jgi:Domain of unknown function (DUF3560)